MLLIRRFRRLVTSTTSQLYSRLQPSTPPKKHIKIDDEERGIPSDTQSRSPLARALKMLFSLIIMLLLLSSLLAYTIYKPSNTIIKWFQVRHPDVIFHLPLPSSRKVVALTLDDAPSPYTPALLQVLKEHNATATFFIIGSQVPSDPFSDPILSEIHAQGHELGNHAQHDEPSISLPTPELVSQIKSLDKLLPENPSGNKYFRPGSGFFNRKMVDAVKELGYKMVLGSVYPHDAQIHSAKRNARHVLSMVRPGAVIIMHDRRGHSVKQLTLVLEGLAKKEYEVVCLGKLLKIKEDSEKEGKKGEGGVQVREF